MKITISYSNEEKSTITSMMMLSGGIVNNTDDNEHYEGSFGEYKYDNANNVIEFNFKEGFIKATAGLTSSYINLIKSFMCNCEMFASSWLLDIKKKEEVKEEPATTDMQE